MKTNYFLLFGIFILVVIGILLYERYMCALNIRDIMIQPLLPEPFENVSDGWAISHIILYTILAYLFPKRIVLLFFVGILWEIIEEGYGWLLRHSYIKVPECIKLSDSRQTWWFGRWHDLVSNSIGLAIGYSLHRIE